jgi:hypothetical protein
MPKPLGNPVRLQFFVDATHAGNFATRRSHTGILLFVDMAPIIWYPMKTEVQTPTRDLPGCHVHLLDGASYCDKSQRKPDIIWI